VLWFSIAMVSVLSEEQSWAPRCVVLIVQSMGEGERMAQVEPWAAMFELTSMPDSWAATVWTPWTNNGQRHHRPYMSSPSIWTNTVGTKCPGQGLWGGLITQRSRVQIPSPRPRRRRSERGPPSADPFPSPKVRTNSNTRPHGEDASSFVDIADEQIRDHPHEELKLAPQPSSLNAEAAGATPWGASPPSEVGDWVLDHGPDLRRWDKKIIGRTHRLLVRFRDRATSPIGHSNQIIAVGVRAVPA
jgi:hypothetical protein